MPAVESSMMELGTTCPEFELTDVVSGTIKSRDEVRGEQGLVVMFICAHCPYVINMEEELSMIARHYIGDGIGFVAISANDALNYPGDAPGKLKEQAEKNEFTFPYLYDDTQEVAKAFKAACTPDFYFFDKEMKCVFRGRFDASTPGNNEPVSGEELSAALDAYLEGEPVNDQQLPSIGCSIKWKS